jgi:hypothetical protein
MKSQLLKSTVATLLLIGSTAFAKPQTEPVPLPYNLTLTGLNQSLAICLDQSKLDLLHQVLNSDTWYDYHRNAVPQIDWMLEDGHLNYETSKVAAWASADGVPGSVKYIARQTTHPGKNPVATLFLEINEGQLISMVNMPTVTFNNSPVADTTDRLGRYNSDEIILTNVVIQSPSEQDEVPLINRNRATGLRFKMKNYVQCLMNETSSRRFQP